MDTPVLIISILLIILVVLFLVRVIRNKELFDITNTPFETQFLNDARVMPPWNIFHEDAVKGIANTIIAQLNKDLNVSYYFLNFENVSTIPTSDGTKMKLTIDFWVHDTINKITKRLISIIDIDNMKKEMKVVELNTSNSGIDVDTQNEILLEPTIDPQLVMTDKNAAPYKGSNFIRGVDEIKLDYSKFMSHEVDQLFQGKTLAVNKNIPNMEFQRNILPPNIMMAEGVPLNKFPSRRTRFCWDTHGVSVSEPETVLRSGLDNSPWYHYPYPYDNPTINKQVTSRDTNNLWLMSSRNTSGRGSDLTY